MQGIALGVMPGMQEAFLGQGLGGAEARGRKPVHRLGCIASQCNLRRSFASDATSALLLPEMTTASHARHSLGSDAKDATSCGAYGFYEAMGPCLS